MKAKALSRNNTIKNSNMIRGNGKLHKREAPKMSDVKVGTARTKITR